MDPILYFLSHSLALHLTLAVLSCLIGMGAGWWIWSRYQRQCATLQAEVQQQKDRLQKLTRERDGLARTQDELQLGLKAAKADGERLKTESALAQEKVLAASQGRIELEDRAKALESQASLDADTIASLRGLLDQATAEGESNKAASDRSEAQHKKQLNALREQTATAQATAAHLTQERDSVRAELKERTQQLQDGERELARIQEEAGAQAGAHEASEAEVERLKKELEALRQSTDPVITDPGESESERERLQSQLTRLAAELSRSEDQTLQARQELEKETKRAQDWEKQLVRYEEEIVRLKQRLETAPKTPPPSQESAAKAAKPSPQTLLFDLPERPI